MTNTNNQTNWMAGHYGIMTHWLFGSLMPEKGEVIKTLDEAVNRFNLDRFLNDFTATGADWLIFTIGQNSGKYASPNSIIDQFCGKDHCSQRDLVFEIATEIHRMGKRFIAYLPCEVAGNLSMHEGFAWNTQEGTNQAEFQRRYLMAVREWSERFGLMLDGWWYDGCYGWSIFNHKYMDWSAWFEASRAGNPDGVVAFNDGSLCNGLTMPVTAGQDYLSGETEVLVNGKIRLGRSETPQLIAYGELARTCPEPVPVFLPETRFVPGTDCQWHSLLPIDCFWGHGNGYADWLPADLYHFLDPNLKAGPMEPPMYPDDELAGFLNNCLKAGGAVTMNVGIYQEGHLGQETIQQLERLNRQVQRGRTRFDG